MVPMKTDEKTGILYRQWGASSPKAVFLLVHGLGAHSERWEFLSEFFLRGGYSSYAIELRGFGETKGLKGHVDSFNIYLEDIRCLHNIILREHPGKKVFLLGESMGGLISFLIAISQPDLFDGLICISPAFLSRLKFTNLNYIKIFLSLFYNPKKQFDIPFETEMATRDAEYQAVMDSDDKEQRSASSRLLFNIAAAQVRCMLFKKRIKAPVLFLVAGKDMLINSKASKTIFDGLKVKDKTMLQYPEMYHALSIDVGKESVFEDILNWVERRI